MNQQERKSCVILEGHQHPRVCTFLYFLLVVLKPPATYTILNESRPCPLQTFCIHFLSVRVRVMDVKWFDIEEIRNIYGGFRCKLQIKTRNEHFWKWSFFST